MDSLLHPLFLYPLLVGFVLGVGAVFHVYKLDKDK
jgi:hypothetical protein